MKKVLRVVSIREQKIPSGVYIIVGLQGEEPPERQGGLVARLQGQKIPDDIKQSLGPFMMMLEGLGGGILSDLALTPEEYKALGSPNVGSAVNMDIEVFKE